MAEKPTLLEEWLAQKTEEPIETNLEIIDPHHHLWDPATQPKEVMCDLFRYRFSFVPYRLCCKSRRAYRYAVRRMCESNAEGRGFLNHMGGRKELRGPSNLDRYMMEELRKDMEGNNVVKTVFVECGWSPGGVPHALQPIGETEMVQNCAAGDSLGRPNAIVAHANLSLGKEIEETLQLHKKYGNVRGIRDSLACYHEPGIVINDKSWKNYDFSKSEAFREGFALLDKYELSYDTWLYHVNIPALTDLARAFPKTTIICDHVGTPIGIGPFAPAGSVMETWKSYMRDLSQCPNVYVKISGLGMGSCGFQFNERSIPPSSDELAKAFGPYYTFCIELFGFKRCMFASNFPVDKMSGSYTAHWNSFKKICNAAGYTEEQKRQLLYETAKTVYRL